MAFLESLDDLRVPPDLLPYPFGDELRGIGHRALAVLKNRPVNEINAAHDGIWVMLDEGEDGITDAIEETLEENDSAGCELIRHSQPQMLKLYMGRFDIKGQADFPNARWAEYFAVLGLAKLKNALDRLKNSYTENPDTSDTGGFARLGRVFVALQDALEAIVTAEDFAAQETLSKNLLEKAAADSQKKISLNARRASLHKHQPLIELKRQCIEYFRKSNPRSMAEAARKFWKTVDENQKVNLRLRNPLRTLTHTLYQYKEGSIPEHIWPG